MLFLQLFHPGPHTSPDCCRRSGTNCYLLEQTTKFSHFYQKMMLKTPKTGFNNQLHLEFPLKKPSFPCNVPLFYPKICPLTSKIRVKWGSLWPFSYIFVFVGVRCSFNIFKNTFVFCIKFSISILFC